MPTLGWLPWGRLLWVDSVTTVANSPGCCPGALYYFYRQRQKQVQQQQEAEQARLAGGGRN